MARNKTKAALEAELYEANDYIEGLEAKLDDIVGIAAGDEEDEEPQEDEEEGEDSDRLE